MCPFYNIDQDDLQKELRVFINLAREKEKEADSVMIARMEVISHDCAQGLYFPLFINYLKYFGLFQSIHAQQNVLFHA